MLTNVSDHQRDQMLRDWLEFERDGHIGDCELRRQAQRVKDTVPGQLGVVFWMRELTFQILLSAYKESPC